MKKTITLLATLLLISTLAISQSKAVKSFQEKYKDDRDATLVTLQGNIFKLMGSIADYSEDEEAKAFSNMADGIKSMQILSLPKYDINLNSEEVAKLKSNIKKESYEELMNVKKGRETAVVILSQGKEDEVRNMLVLVENKDKFVLINIDGLLKMKDLAYIADHHDKWN